MTAADSNPITPRPGARRTELVILIIAAAWLSILAPRGINLSDEGFYFSRAWELTRGAMIYRDYYSHTGPVSALLQAAMIEVFGFNLFAGRIYGAVQGVLIVALALGMMRRRLKSPAYVVPAILLIPYSIALSGFPHYNIDNAFFLILCLASLERYLDRPRPSMIFWASVCGALAAGCKQTAAAVSVPVVLFALGQARAWFRDRRALPELAAASAGFALPALPVIAFLARGHALQEAWQCLAGTGSTRGVVLFSILPPALAAFFAGALALRAIIWLGRRRPTLAAPFWTAALLVAIAVAAFAPWQISTALLCGVIGLSILLWVRPDDDADRPFWNVMRLFGLAMFATGLLANVDFAHMIFSSAGAIFLAAIPAGRLWQARREATGRRLAAVGGIGFALILAAGVYLDLTLLGRYFQTGPRWAQTAVLDLPGARHIRATPDHARDLTQTVNWVKQNTAPDEKIFAYPWNCLLYPLSGRLSASYYTFILYDSIDRRGVQRMFEDLERNRTRVIVVEMEGDRIKHVVFDDLKSVIEPWLLARFAPVARFGRYQIMTRKGAGG